MTVQRIATNIAVCALKDGGIGYEGKIPWKLSKDMKYFRDLTIKHNRNSDGDPPNVVLMGKNTWNSIPSKFRPLEARINVILSSDLEFRKKSDGIKNVYCFDSLSSFGKSILNKDFPSYSTIFVIGGVTPYTKILNRSVPCFSCDKIFLTQIFSDSTQPRLKCDVFLPKGYLDGFRKLSREECEQVGQNVRIGWCEMYHDDTSNLDYEFQIWQNIGKLSSENLY